jgi:hypothetical protein
VQIAENVPPVVPKVVPRPQPSAEPAVSAASEVTPVVTDAAPSIQLSVVAGIEPRPTGVTVKVLQTGVFVCVQAPVAANVALAPTVIEPVPDDAEIAVPPVTQQLSVVEASHFKIVLVSRMAHRRNVLVNLNMMF